MNSNHAVGSQLLSDFQIRLTAATRALPTVHGYPAHSTETTLLILNTGRNMLDFAWLSPRIRFYCKICEDSNPDLGQIGIILT